MPDALTQEQRVSAAFSAQSPVFDEAEENNPVIAWMRARVRDHVMSVWKKGDRILELNAGTGLDAVYFVQNGFSVHATDNAGGMIAELQRKAATLQPAGKLSVQECSFLELEKTGEKKFDHIFSNFGGLNCTGELGKAIASFDSLLRPGGTATLVIMPRICPWEFMLALKGNFKTAFRRLKRHGAVSHIEGHYFTSYYYSLSQVTRMFGKNFERISAFGLGATVPPPYLGHFAANHPRMYSTLVKMEKAIAAMPPFRSCADHFVLTMKKTTA